LRAKRDKLIAKAEELLPKQVVATDASLDVAAQLKAAMQKNAFGDLRFSGRDPIEVIDELRAQWADAGPLLDDADRAQGAEFEAVAKQVLDAAGPAAEARADRADRGDRGDRGERRRRRDRNSGELPIANAPVAAAPLPAPAPAPPVASVPAAAPVAAAPVAAVDTPTAPAKLPFEPLPPPPVPVVEAAPEAPRRPSMTTIPPMDDLDTGWDLGDDDPTASSKPTETTNTPSSSEMAGDGAPGGDGIDEPGWD